MLFQVCKLELTVPIPILRRIACLIEKHKLPAFFAHLSKRAHVIECPDLRQYVAQQSSEFNAKGMYPYASDNSSVVARVFIPAYANNDVLWNSRHTRLSLIDITDYCPAPFGFLPDLRSTVCEIGLLPPYDVTNAFSRRNNQDMVESVWFEFSWYLLCQMYISPLKLSSSLHRHQRM